MLVDFGLSCSVRDTYDDEVGPMLNAIRRLRVDGRIGIFAFSMTVSISHMFRGRPAARRSDVRLLRRAAFSVLVGHTKEDSVPEIE